MANASTNVQNGTATTSTADDDSDDDSDDSEDDSDDSDDSSDDDDFEFSGEFSEAEEACDSLGSDWVFAAPRTAYENWALRRRMRVSGKSRCGRCNRFKDPPFFVCFLYCLVLVCATLP